MSEQPRASLARVLEDLGSTVLELLCGDADRAVDIDSIVIYDAVEDAAWDRHALVLGAGLSDPEQIVRVIDGLGAHSATGLILRTPITITPEIRSAAERSGVPILGLMRGASWVQLTTILRSVLSYDAVGEHGNEMLGGVPSGDLFALANAIAALLDAPVTIEDRSSRVLAFSGRQDEADPSRIGTILDRRVSVARTRDLEDRGVFRELYRADEPIFVEPPASGLEGFTMPRVALAIRAGDEILGSIWAAVRQPLPPDRAETFRDIGKLVALHLLSQRAGADVERRLRADLLATALEGGAGASEAADRLGLANHAAVVMALGLDDEWSPNASHADRVAERQRLGDALAMHLLAAQPGSTSALVGNVVYGIVPVSGSGEGATVRVTRLAHELLDRTGTHDRTIVGIGAVANEPAALASSRQAADRALRVMRSSSQKSRVGCIEDVSIDALLIELGDLMHARGDAIIGPVARLLEYDQRHRSCLVESLRAWLDCFGDMVAASQTVRVHPNSFRYRLRRISEVGGIDLADPRSRLALTLQLRLLGE